MALPQPPIGAPAPPGQILPTPAPPPVPPHPVWQLGQLMTVLGQDPKYRPRVLEFLREAAPNLPIPELDVARDAAARMDAATKPLKEENAQLTDRLTKLERSIEQQRWMDAHGVDDEEMAAVATLAKEEGISKPETALKYYRQAELGRPRGTGSAAAMTEESRKELHRNPKQWYEREAMKILGESRRRRGA